MRVNLGKKGASLSVGGRGARVTMGANGTTVTAGLPGTGVSYSTRYKHAPASTPPPLPTRAPSAGDGIIPVGIVLSLILGGTGAMFRKEAPELFIGWVLLALAIAVFLGSITYAYRRTEEPPPLPEPLREEPPANNEWLADLTALTEAQQMQVYYLENGNARGPETYFSVLSQVKLGVIPKATQICHYGQDRWQSLDQSLLSTMFAIDGDDAVTIEEKPIYLYEVNGEARGPVTMAQLRAMRALPHDVRTVSGETLVCHYEQHRWLRLADWMA